MIYNHVESLTPAAADPEVRAAELIRYTESFTHEKKTSHHRVFDSHSARKSYAYDINA